MCTDIQQRQSMTERFVFIRGLDVFGSDLERIRGGPDLVRANLPAVADAGAGSVNTLGFVKSAVWPLVPSTYFGRWDGVWLLRCAYEAHMLDATSPPCAVSLRVLVLSSRDTTASCARAREVRAELITFLVEAGLPTDVVFGDHVAAWEHVASWLPRASEGRVRWLIVSESAVPQTTGPVLAHLLRSLVEGGIGLAAVTAAAAADDGQTWGAVSAPEFPAQAASLAYVLDVACARALLACGAVGDITFWNSVNQEACVGAPHPLFVHWSA